MPFVSGRPVGHLIAFHQEFAHAWLEFCPFLQADSIDFVGDF